MTIKDHLLRIQERIGAAAARSGRRPEEITLIGVSKTHPAIAIQEAYQAGVRHFGENRVQEWEVKRVGTNNLAATWHLIGHLQSNKAAKAARLFHSVDSVDDLALAQKLDRARGEASLAQKLRILIEVRIAKEETKSGLEIDPLPAVAEKIVALPRLELRDDLKTKLGLPLPVLSMGMSHDFEVAIAEGATEVRVGTALFGGRM